MDAGDKQYECTARGLFRKKNIKPYVGDVVEITDIDDVNGEAVLDKIEKRKNQLIRPAVANIDQLIVVFAVGQPAPDFMLIDKLLVTAEYKGIECVLCMNKVDLNDENEYIEYREQFEKAGYKVINVSCEDILGIEHVKKALKGKCSAFAGQSGVGKSTILNTIGNKQLMETGAVSRKIERGKHTTRHAELIPLGDSTYIVDTPGFSSFEIENVDYRDIGKYYPEINNLLAHCRFNGCSHISEPECAVKEAVEKSEMHPDRYKRYIQLFNQLKEIYDNKYR